MTPATMAPDTPETMAALHALCFETPRPWKTEEFASLLTTPGVITCRHPNGFLIGRVVLDEAELLTIAVDPGHRRAGVGAALLAQFHRDSADLGAVRAFLEVNAQNFGAIALYENAGYVQSGKRPGYYRTPEGMRDDALIFTRALPV